MLALAPQSILYSSHPRCAVLPVEEVKPHPSHHSCIGVVSSREGAGFEHHRVVVSWRQSWFVGIKASLVPHLRVLAAEWC